MSAPDPPPLPPPKPGSPGWYPSWIRSRTFIVVLVISIVAIAIAAAVAASMAQDETTISELAPAVRFVTFEPDKQELLVGESTNLLLNIQNSEERTVESAQVVITIEPEAGRDYLSIRESVMDLPALHTDARTGEISVTITATGTPATEAVYLIKGTIFAEETKSDVREFRLTIRQ